MDSTAERGDKGEDEDDGDDDDERTGEVEEAEAGLALGGQDVGMEASKEYAYKISEEDS
jgi:hypothetical protein